MISANSRAHGVLGAEPCETAFKAVQLPEQVSNAVCKCNFLRGQTRGNSNKHGNGAIVDRPAVIEKMLGEKRRPPKDKQIIAFQTNQP